MKYGKFIHVARLKAQQTRLLGMEVGELKTDSTWDPVRDHEAFKSIVQ